MEILLRRKFRRIVNRDKLTSAGKCSRPKDEVGRPVEKKSRVHTPYVDTRWSKVEWVIRDLGGRCVLAVVSS